MSDRKDNQTAQSGQKSKEMDKKSLAGEDQTSKSSNASPRNPIDDFFAQLAKRNRTILASSIASVTSTTISYPLDTIKARMQSLEGYKSITKCATKTYAEGGISLFFSGMLAPLASIALVRSTSFAVYQTAKYKYSPLTAKLLGEQEPLVVVNQPGSTPTLGSVLCFGLAGSTAGAAGSLIACPFELIKLSAQISSSPEMGKPQKALGSLELAQLLYESKGLAGIYAGYQYHLPRELIGSFVYFSTYESTKQLLVATSSSTNPTNPVAVAFAGGLCGLVAQAAGYAIDTAKVRHQKECLKRILGHHGPLNKEKVTPFVKGAYAGLGVAMARSAIVNAVFFSTFEFVKKQINAL